MNDAQLDVRLWGDAVYRIREAFQAVHSGNQDILKTTGFKLCQYTEPELCTPCCSALNHSSSDFPEIDSGKDP